MTAVLDRPAALPAFTMNERPQGTLRVHVRQHHIDAATPKSPSSCPIALAMRPIANVFVTPVMVRYYEGDAMAPLPKIAKEFVAAYDAGEKVEPFEFDIRL